MKWRAFQARGSVVLNKLLQEWRYCMLAIGFFTRLPVPVWEDYQDAHLNHAAKYFPLVGMLVGGLGALAYLLGHQYLPAPIAILLSMAVTIYLTGAFHEDGLADSVDGLGGGWNREQILNIMVDSRLGTYGAVALFFVLFAKFYLLLSMQAYLVPFALIVAHTLSRLSAVWMMKSLQYAKAEGKAKPLATRLSLPAIVLANLIGLLTFGLIACAMNDRYTIQQLLQLSFWIAVLMMVSWFWWRQKTQRWIGGYTGDTLGAVQQITELACYLGFIVWSANV